MPLLFFFFMENKDNFLDYIPIKTIEWEFEKDNKEKVYIIKERTKNKLLKKIIDALGRDQYFHIHLDEFGSYVWLLIDGKRNVGDIVLLMKEKFKDKIEPAEQRISYFIGMLKKNNFIGFANGN